MLKCQGGCQRMVNEYYVMPDNKIFCYDCWRYGKIEAETFAHRKQEQFSRVQREEKLFIAEQQDAQRRLEELDNAIRIEKNRYSRAWSDYEEDYDINRKPFNYADVELLREKRKTLYFQIRDAKSPMQREKPLMGGVSVSYYMQARFISQTESHYYETITLPAERAARAKQAAEEARLRAEEQERQERKRRESERLQKEKAQCLIKEKEDKVLNDKKISLDEKLDLVQKTSNDLVLIKLAKDKSPNVRRKVAKLPMLDKKTLDVLLADTDVSIIKILCSRNDISPTILQKYAMHESTGIRSIVAANPKTPVDTLLKLASDSSLTVRNAIIKNMSTATHIKEIARKLNQAEKQTNSGCMVYFLIVLTSSILSILL